MEKDVELTREPLPDWSELCFRQGGLFVGRKPVAFPASLGNLQDILRDNSDWDLDAAPSGDTIVIVSGVFYGRSGKFIFLFDKDDNFDGLFIPIGVEVDRKDAVKVTEAVNESFASLEKTLDAEPYFEKHKTPEDEQDIIYTSRHLVLIISPDQDGRGLHAAIWRKPE